MKVFDKPLNEKNTIFRQQLSDLINTQSMEEGSNTPDYILAAYLNDCLEAFDKATLRRRDFFSRTDIITPIDPQRTNKKD